MDSSRVLSVYFALNPLSVRLLLQWMVKARGVQPIIFGQQKLQRWLWAVSWTALISGKLALVHEVLYCCVICCTLYIIYKCAGKLHDITSRNSGWAPLVYALACSCHHLPRYFTPILPLRLHLALLNGCELIVCCTDSSEHRTRNDTSNHAAESCFMNHGVEALE